MGKELFTNEAQFEFWKEAEKTPVGSRTNSINNMGAPYSYPCFIVYYWYEDYQSRDWLEYEYVYPADFDVT